MKISKQQQHSIDELAKKWYEILLSKYPEWKWLIGYGVDHLKFILNEFYVEKLDDNQFKTAILSEDQYHQRLSEFIVADRLKREGFTLSSKDYGPDFKAIKNGQTIWFEVITPKEINQVLWEEQCLNHDSLNRASLLKVTGAIKEKAEKTYGYIYGSKSKKTGKDIPSVISETDPVIIVVNDSLLHPADELMVGLTKEFAKGDSLYPLVIEALFGLDRPFWKKSYGRTESGYELEWTLKNAIQKENGNPVSTQVFFSDEYKHISGILLLTMREEYGLARAIYGNLHNRGLLVLNPNCQNKIDVSLNIETLREKQLHNLLGPERKPINFFSTITTYGHYEMVNKVVQKMYELTQE
ncbi:hypothetical protein [Acinetobacter guillouiae]|uniref:hypothetical protein n=1 Tax=Acinetobacter guillouiae TaxID=106649 RepID=UPI003AF82DD4